MKQSNYYKINLSLILIMLLYAPLNTAADSEAKAIINKADKPFVFTKIYSISAMTLFESGKVKTAMEIESYTMSKEERYYSLAIYRKPARLKGTAYLVIDNDLWIRFASTGRVRKLSSSARENSLGASDFSYYDMGESGKGLGEKYYSRLLNDRIKVNGRICYEIELTPRKEKESNYDKMLVFIDRENYHYLKIDYFKNGVNIKTLFFLDYRRVNGRDYPFKLVMKNNIKPTKTEIVTKKVELDSLKVKEKIFTIDYLKSIR